MPDNSQQIARVLEKLLQSGRGKLSFGWMIVLLALAIGYLLAEPSLEARWRVDLPGVHTPDLHATRPDVPRRSTSPTSPSETSRSTKTQPPELSEVVEELGQDTFRTPAGLIYGKGSAHRTRLAHLLSHAKDEPHRPGQHGVFDESDPARLILLIDEAYHQGVAGKNTDREREGNREVFTVDLRRRIGYIGGEQGKRRHHPPATKVRLVVEGERFITAFPVHP